MKYFILLLTIFSFISCTDSKGVAPDQRIDMSRVKNGGMYAQDVRTGLCFFVVDGYQAVSMTCVPCEALANKVPIVEFYSK